MTLVADAGLDPTSQTDTWITFAVTLREANWHLNTLAGTNPTPNEFQNVLTNVTALYIRGDFFSGVDTASLDNVMIQSQVPSLQILCGSDNVTLQWLASAFAFALQSAQKLCQTNSWATVSNAVTIIGTNIQVTVPTRSEHAFFRLKLLQP